MKIAVQEFDEKQQSLYDATQLIIGVGKCINNLEDDENIRHEDCAEDIETAIELLRKVQANI